MSFAEGIPTVKVQLDKERELGFTLGAMRRCRDLGVLNVDTSDKTAMMLALPEYVWACMDKDGRAALSVEDIAEIMVPQNVAAIAVKITELFTASQPEDVPGKNGEPAAAKKPTAGKKRTSASSGQSALTT